MKAVHVGGLDANLSLAHRPWPHLHSGSDGEGHCGADLRRDVVSQVDVVGRGGVDRQGQVVWTDQCWQGAWVCRKEKETGVAHNNNDNNNNNNNDNNTNNNNNNDNDFKK